MKRISARIQISFFFLFTFSRVAQRSRDERRVPLFAGPRVHISAFVCVVATNRDEYNGVAGLALPRMPRRSRSAARIRLIIRNRAATGRNRFPRLGREMTWTCNFAWAVIIEDRHRRYAAHRETAQRRGPRSWCAPIEIHAGSISREISPPRGTHPIATTGVRGRRAALAPFRFAFGLSSITVPHSVPQFQLRKIRRNETTWNKVNEITSIKSRVRNDVCNDVCGYIDLSSDNLSNLQT